MSALKIDALFLFFSMVLPMNAFAVFSVAHRGAPHFAPENTLASFKRAIELKANYLEMDVQQTIDGKIIVMHDLSLGRTTNGRGKIAEISSKELALLDAGSWHGESFKGERVPELEEVFELGKHESQVGFIIELKKGDDVYPGIESKVVKMIEDHQLEERVILKSFSMPLLLRLRKLLPKVPQIYVFLTSWPGMNMTIDTFLRFHSPLEQNVEYLQTHGTLTSAHFIQAAHEHGKKVIVWGVEKIEDMQRWTQLKVDGIETDRLDLLNSVILGD